MQELFFQLLRVYVGESDSLNRKLSDHEWKQMYSIAKSQAVIGIAFEAVKKLPESQKPPTDIFWDWMAMASTLRNRNVTLNSRTAEAEERLRADGFKNVCILKGQGNSAMYPDPLARQGGDIDIWADGGKQRIIQYASSIKPVSSSEDFDEHIHLALFDDAITELHFCIGPANMKPVKHRLTAWFNQKLKGDFRQVSLPGGKPVTVPTLEMNFIHQVAHFHHHVFQMGMKQLLDFYYLLQSTEQEYWQRVSIKKSLRQVRLLRVARGMLYVLKHVMHLPESKMPFSPSSHYGKFFLKEMLRGGNFGWYADASNSPCPSHLRYLPYFPSITLRYIYGKIIGTC